MGGSIILKAAGVAALVLPGTAAYLCLWPVPADPVSWQAPMPPGYTGAHAANTRLADLRMIDLGGEAGPEHIAVGPDGKLYAAVESGAPAGVCEDLLLPAIRVHAQQVACSVSTSMPSDA